MSLVYLDELCDSISETFDKSTENIVLINTSDVFNGKVLNHEFVPNRDIKGQFKKLFQKGDILYSEIRPANKHYAFVDFESKNYVASTKLMVLRPKKDKIRSKYLYYILKNKDVVNFLQGLAESRSGTFPQITFSELSTIDINLPSLENQDIIVEIIDNIESKIENLEKINKNLLSIADAIFKKEFINFDEYLEEDLISSDFGLIPKNWYYKTLDEISDVAIGKTPPRKETWWFSEKEGVKWVSIKDLGNSGTYIFETSEYLTEEAIDKFNVKLIPEDTVILSFKLTVGRLGITTEEMTTNEAIAHFKLNQESPISKEYLYLYLKNFNYEELGSTSSIAKAINSKIVKKIPILVPESNKLNEFKELFENLFNEIKSNQLEINNLTKLRDTLLPKLMSGEIDVSQINCDDFLFVKIILLLLLY